MGRGMGVSARLFMRRNMLASDAKVKSSSAVQEEANGAVGSPGMPDGSAGYRGRRMQRLTRV